MGQTSSHVKTVVLPAGLKVYHASVKFRELQIDRLLANEPLESFPTKRFFFVSKVYEVALLYSKDRLNSKDYYAGLSGPIPNNKNKDSVHVYETIGEQKMIDITDPETIKYILFEDEKSPFHISNKTPCTHNNKKFAKGLDQYAEYIGKPFSHLSGFALVLISTNYHKHVMLGEPMKRYSTYEGDLVLVNMLYKYLEGSDIAGWSQKRDAVFHQEYMFFDPEKSLKPVYDDPLEWVKSWPHKHVVLTPEGTISAEKKTKDKLDGLSTVFQNAETMLKEKIDELNIMLASPVTQEFLDKSYDGDVNKYHQEILRKIEIYNKNLLSLKRLLLQDIKTNILPYLKKFDAATAQEYYFKSRKLCKLYLCDNPFTFENCQGGLTKLFYEMKKYPLKTSIHHVGETVGDHSVWVARTIFKWFAYKNSPWTRDIWEELRNITLMAAFTHDIGKIGDLDYKSLSSFGTKRDHPTKGYEYFLNKLQFKSEHGMGPVPSFVLDFIGCKYTNKDVVISAIVSGMHHYLGELLMSIFVLPPSRVGRIRSTHFPFSFNTQRYYLAKDGTLLAAELDRFLGLEFKYIVFLHKMLIYLDETDRRRVFYNNKDNLRQLLHILFAVSAADNYGAYPVEINRDDSVFEPDTSKILDPEVLFTQTNIKPKATIIDILKPYYRYVYHTYGLTEKAKFFAAFEKVKNLEVFYRAWNEYDRFNLYVKEPSLELPSMYRHLGNTQTSVFNNLKQLLKYGIINTDTPKSTSISPEILNVLNAPKSVSLSSSVIVESPVIKDIAGNPLGNVEMSPQEAMAESPMMQDITLPGNPSEEISQMVWTPLAD